MGAHAREPHDGAVRGTQRVGSRCEPSAGIITPSGESTDCEELLRGRSILRGLKSSFDLTRVCFTVLNYQLHNV